MLLENFASLLPQKTLFVKCYINLKFKKKVKEKYQ